MRLPRTVVAASLLLVVAGCAPQPPDDSTPSALNEGTSKAGARPTPPAPALPANITPTAYVTIPVETNLSEPPMLDWLRWQKVRVETDSDGDARIYDSAAARHALVQYRRILRLKLDTIAQNVANASTTRDARGELNPYRRKIVAVNEKGDVEIKTDSWPFRQVYDPSNPDADDKGLVKYPNVDLTVEYVSAMEASAEYDAVLKILQRFDPTIVVGESSVKPPAAPEPARANFPLLVPPR